jgi:hypothetical protein
MAKVLVPHTDKLPVPEVLRRIAPAFRQVVIDWLAGEEHLKAVQRMMKGLGASAAALPLPEERVVFVRVADVAGEENAIQFKLRERGTTAEILISYSSDAHERACGPLLDKLAELLGCTVADAEWD